ncbi:MAG: nucleoside phosphorylase [Deltaproteobacteria bacterium]|nr:nucleoside phosphorylase [Deltaproteobacteria bacterium]
MTCPNFKNKYLKEALFQPQDYIKFVGCKGGGFPSKYLITYQPGARQYFIKKYKPKLIKHKFLVEILVYKNVGFIKMTGIGAPHAVAVVEELIALGGREFLNIGTAGGLQHDGVFLLDKALRDEGTSYHYIKDSKFAYPDKQFTSKLGAMLTEKGIDFEKGPSWTIDAPYRETKAEIKKYAKEGIVAVEMEAAALFALAQYRKVRIASAIVVSDVLGKKWKPRFSKRDVVATQNRLIDAAVQFCHVAS